MRKTTSGFTIVELLIVIVVIGILASVVIVAYNGAQARAQNASRLAELKAWQKSFIQYKTANSGLYPAFTNGGYCLGTGFPSQKCRDYNSVDTFYTEAGSAALMSALSTYDPPKGVPRVPINGSIGPYAEYWTEVIHLSSIFKGSASDCPAGTYFVWTDNAGRVICRIDLERLDS